MQKQVLFALTFSIHYLLLLANYTKKLTIIKAKNPPIKKNGANGIKRCFLYIPHIVPVKQAIINAIDKPVAPSHIPPVPINFMSPIPIGVVVSVLFRLRIMSKTNPIKAAIIYPKAPATALSAEEIGQGKKLTISKPISKSGNKYASGIILLRKSATEINHAHSKAQINKTIKNI